MGDNGNGGSGNQSLDWTRNVSGAVDDDGNAYLVVESPTGGGNPPGHSDPATQITVAASDRPAMIWYDAQTGVTLTTASGWKSKDGNGEWQPISKPTGMTVTPLQQGTQLKIQDNADPGDYYYLIEGTYNGQSATTQDPQLHNEAPPPRPEA